MVKVVINSLFRDTSISKDIGDYYFRLARPVKNVRTVMLEYVGIPKSVYPVVSGYNNKLQTVVNSNSYTATLSEKNYTGAQLATHLESILDTATTSEGGAWTVSYNAQTNTLSFSHSTQDWSFPIQTTTPDIEHLLGLDPESATGTISSGATEELTYQVDLNPFRYLYLDISFSGSSTVQGNNIITSVHNHGFFIPMANAFGDVVEYFANNQYIQTESAQNMSIEYVHVVLDVGLDNFEDFANGLDHIIVLELK